MLKLATKFAATDAALSCAWEAGFRFAELYLDADILADVPGLVERCRKHGFGYTAHFPNSAGPSPQSMTEAAARLYRELRCSCMVMHRPMFEKFGQALSEHEPDIVLAIENHKLNPDGFERWAQTNPGLALDVEHLWKFTLSDGSLDSLLAELRRFLTHFGGKLKHVHLPGYWPGFTEHRPMYCAREMIFPVLSLLAEANFSGSIVAEANPEFQNATELQMDVLLVETWRRNAAGSPSPPVLRGRGPE